MFQGWDDFFMMVGTSGATLIGLLFVAITLGAGLSTPLSEGSAHKNGTSPSPSDGFRPPVLRGRSGYKRQTAQRRAASSRLDELRQCAPNCPPRFGFEVQQFCDSLI